MYRKRLNHREIKALVLKVVADCRGLADQHIRNWQPVNEAWPTTEGAVYLRLSDDTQVAVERGSLEQQIHITRLLVFPLSSSTKPSIVRNKSG